MKAAASVKEYYKGNPQVIEKTPEAKVEDQTEQKQQVNAGHQRSTQSTYTETEDSQLVTATRLNKKGALAERLKRAGY